MSLDLKILFLLNNLAGKSYCFDSLVIFFAKYLQYFLIFFFIVLLIFWKYKHNDKIRIILVTAGSIIISRLAITELVRFFYYRPRPFFSHNVYQLFFKNSGTFSSSFPSGHSAFFFAMSAAIYFYNKKWGAVFFIASILMNISRVIAGIHYPSDILWGMIIGIASAYSVFILSKHFSNN
ncbi:MAG: phosphatase PAP2 family protein [Patescibacteria group bacterium]